MSDAAEIITTTQAGRTFRASRRTAAHLESTIERLAHEWLTARLVVIQGCYNTGVAASAGTHDFDAVLDVQIVGLDWLAAQAFLRKCGWAAWYRYPPTFSSHIHMVSLGYPGQVGIYVPGQVADYYGHRSGLAGHVADNTWHPIDIDSIIFDYPAWVAGQEERDMANYADQLDRIEAAAKAAAASAKDAATSADRARAGSYKRDKKLIELARATTDDVDALVAKVDKA